MNLKPAQSMKSFSIDRLTIGNHLPLTLISGPCAMESQDLCHEVAGKLKEICSALEIGLIFKASFDKANRTSLTGKRGLGLSGSIQVFKDIKHQYSLPTITDIHTAEHAPILSDVVDVLQIPAFLCRQTDLLIAAGKTGAAINIKKGQFLAPQDMKHAVRKVEAQGNNRILLTERGSSFGYHNLVVDMRSLPIMSETGYPVIMDATHAVQLPGGGDGQSSGERRYAAVLARAATAVGIAGLFIETHPNPDKAFSDGANMIPLDKMAAFLEPIVALDRLIKQMVTPAPHIT